MLHHLKGIKKVLITMQQFCIIVHHTCLALPWFVFRQEILNSLVDDDNTRKYADDFMAVEKTKYEAILKTLADVMHYQYYFLSLMFSIDIYKMVCHPFQYSEFSSAKNLFKYLAIGTGVCLVLATDSMAMIFVLPEFARSQKKISLSLEVNQLKDTQKYQENVLYGFEIFKLVKLIILKTNQGNAKHIRLTIMQNCCIMMRTFFTPLR